jgi:hypothetical protein
VSGAIARAHLTLKTVAALMACTRLQTSDVRIERAPRGTQPTWAVRTCWVNRFGLVGDADRLLDRLWLLERQDQQLVDQPLEHDVPRSVPLGRPGLDEVRLAIHGVRSWAGWRRCGSIRVRAHADMSAVAPSDRLGSGRARRVSERPRRGASRWLPARGLQTCKATVRSPLAGSDRNVTMKEQK